MAIDDGCCGDVRGPQAQVPCVSIVIECTAKAFVQSFSKFGGAVNGLAGENPDREDEMSSSLDGAAGTLHPDFLPLLTIWQETRGTRSLPLWRDFRPERMAKEIFGRLFLVEVLAGATPDRPDFRYGLIGETLVDTFGRRVTGRLVGPLVFGDAGEAAVAFHREIFRRRRACISQGQAGWDHVRIRYEAIYLPFARVPDGNVAVIVSLMRFLSRLPIGQSATLNTVSWQEVTWL